MQIFKEEKTTILSANELFFGNSNNIFSSNTIASEHFTIDAALLVFFFKLVNTFFQSMLDVLTSK